MDEITLAPKVWRLGTKKYYRYRFWEEGGINLSTATSTIKIYDSAGATVVAAAAMTLTTSDSNRKGVFAYYLTTGAAMMITAAGEYRVEITHVFDGETRVLQGALTIYAAPA